MLLRKPLRIGRYRKRFKRDEEKGKVFLKFGLKRKEEKEKDNFIPVGFLRRKVRVLFSVERSCRAKS